VDGVGEEAPSARGVAVGDSVGAGVFAPDGASVTGAGAAASVEATAALIVSLRLGELELGELVSSGMVYIPGKFSLNGFAFFGGVVPGLICKQGW